MKSRTAEDCWSNQKRPCSRETGCCLQTLRGYSGKGEPGSLTEHWHLESDVATCVLQVYCVLGLGAEGQEESCFGPQEGKPLLETHSEVGREGIWGRLSSLG